MAPSLPPPPPAEHRPAPEVKTSGNSKTENFNDETISAIRDNLKKNLAGVFKKSYGIKSHAPNIQVKKSIQTSSEAGNRRN